MRYSAGWPGAPATANRHPSLVPGDCSFLATLPLINWETQAESKASVPSLMIMQVTNGLCWNGRHGSARQRICASTGSGWHYWFEPEVRQRPVQADCSAGTAGVMVSSSYT